MGGAAWWVGLQAVGRAKYCGQGCRVWVVGI